MAASSPTAGLAQPSLHSQPHDTVRLRIINGSATTCFNLEFPGGPNTTPIRNEKARQDYLLRDFKLFSLVWQRHSDFGVGAGLQIRY